MEHKHVLKNVFFFFHTIPIVVLDSIDFYYRGKENILLNFIFCVLQKKKPGFEQCEGEKMMPESDNQTTCIQTRQHRQHELHEPDDP